MTTVINFNEVDTRNGFYTAYTSGLGGQYVPLPEYEVLESEVKYINTLLEKQTHHLESKCAQVIELTEQVEYLKTEYDRLKVELEELKTDVWNEDMNRMRRGEFGKDF